MTQKTTPSIEALTHLIETVHRLRAPGGCPWDRAQTHQSLRQYLMEEANEVLDVLDQIHTSEDLKRERIQNSFREELGDLLMQVLLHSEMAREVGAFDFYEVARALDEKLIRRHPHVFAEAQASSADDAFQRWEKEKAKEKAGKVGGSILDGVPKGLPALQRASRVLEKVTKAGFQWNDIQGPLNKVEEEFSELKVEIQALEQITRDPQSHTTPEVESQIRKRVESELGDVFLTLCNVAYLMKVNPEDSLRSTMSRFEKRFRHIEERLKEHGKTPDQSNLAEMDLFWDEAKKLESVQVWGLTGGIASGKSTVARIFTEHGIPVIDADRINRELSQENGLAYPALLKRFGTGDRTKIKELVFSDPNAKKDLEEILHPLIQAQSKKEIRALAHQHPVIIYEATLLVETGRYQDFTGLIVVESSPEIRLNRILEREPMSKELAQKIIDSQLSDEERRKAATVILNNSDGIEKLRSDVETLIRNKGWNRT